MYWQGAVPALLGAQRFAMYGSLANPKSLEAMACEGTSPNIIMGMLFAFFPRPSAAMSAGTNSTCGAASSGRRLQIATEESPAVNALLLADLGDTVCTLLLLSIISFAVQGLLMLGYASTFNRKYHRALAASASTGQQTSSSTTTESAKSDINSPSLAPDEAANSGAGGDVSLKLPAFRGLPSLATFPGFHLILLTTFATGLIETSSAVYGAYSADYAIRVGLITLALVVFALVLLSLVHQTAAIVRFHKHGLAASIWQQAEEPATIHDMDDPLLKLLAKCWLMGKPRSRCKGEYAPPSQAEPARTERCIRRALTLGGLFPCFGKRFQLTHEQQSSLAALAPEQRAAHHYELLSLWLGPGSGGSLRGALHGVVVMYLQVRASYHPCAFLTTTTPVWLL